MKRPVRMNLPAAQPEELRLRDGSDAVLVFARSVDRVALIHRLVALDLVDLAVLADIGPRAAQLLDLLDGPGVVPPPHLLSVRDHTARDETEAHSLPSLYSAPTAKQIILSCFAHLVNSITPIIL